MGSSPDFEEILQKGCDLFTQYRFTEAMSAFTQALNLEPDNSEALNNKGFLYLKLGEYGLAMRYFDRAVRNDRSYGPALANLKIVRSRLKLEPVDNQGSLLDRMEKIEKAYLHGILAFENKLFKKALGHFQTILDVNPYDEEAWNNRGLCLGKLGKTREAVQSFENALVISPEYHVARSNKSRYIVKSEGEEPKVKVTNLLKYAWGSHNNFLKPLV